MCLRSVSARSLLGTVGVFVIAAVALVAPARAQTPSGEISGVVTDPSGSVVPGVTITLTNAGHQCRPRSQTNDSGLYVDSGVPTRDLHAEGRRSPVSARSSAGTSRSRSAARIGSTVTLEVGELTNIVEIAGGAPVLQSENASIGTVIENRSIVELPLNGRNYLQLASLIPGATTNGPSSSQGQQRMGGQRNSFALNVAGQRIHFNHYSLDGIENTDLNFNSYMLLPSVDALQEFKVESGLFDAEYGRAIAQINVSTKSGTNQFHGTVFEFLRNSALDAKNYFDRADRPIPPFKRNQYGLTVDGPVIMPEALNGRDRLFFLFNWEGLARAQGADLDAVGAADGLAHRRLLQLRDASGTYPIYDPATRVFDAAGNVIQAPTPFPGNRIPANRIDPVSRKLLDFYPAAAAGTRPAPTSSTTRPGASTPISSPIGFDFIESSTTRAGSSATASRTSSATTRSRFRTWGSTPTPTCTSACWPTRGRSARTR